jgi:hypothetical protein
MEQQIVSIVVDYPHDNMMSLGIPSAASDYDLEFEVIEQNGPAGGNPVIRFFGPYKNVLRFMVDYSPSLEDFQDLMQDIK